MSDFSATDPSVTTPTTTVDLVRALLDALVEHDRGENQREQDVITGP